VTAQARLLLRFKRFIPILGAVFSAFDEHGHRLRVLTATSTVRLAAASRTHATLAAFLSARLRRGANPAQTGFWQDEIEKMPKFSTTPAMHK